jgi:hypothetical protein
VAVGRRNQCTTGDEARPDRTYQSASQSAMN